ncbi:MAG: 4-(cytidine 5'-diphospho)-2-C-methyl-D-erythritol kinase [Ktedonobacterales bacterium]
MLARQSMFVAAHAKINLTLDVLGKRDDGYHALASVMQTVAPHDTLLVSANTRGALRLVCDDATLTNGDNLALRAAQLLKAEIGDERLGATIELRKAVPMQAGLGGGSSDAAAVLNALDTLWGAGYSLPALETFGARLGSDVPFFLRGGTALIEGRGEVVTPLPDAEPLWLILAKPRIGLSTATVFRSLPSSAYSNGAATRQVVQAVAAGQPLALESLFNALEPGVLSAFPAVRAVRDALSAAGAPAVRMSGSGPTVFAPFREIAQARVIYEKLLPAPYDVWLTHTSPGAQAHGMRQTT